MPIKRINEFPEGSGSLSNDDVFLFMDDPSGSGITKKISLSDVASAIGGGGGPADTGDITFNGSTISTANENQSMTITTNGSGDIYIGADRNMIFDMNAISGRGIILQDSQEDGYDDEETPSTLRVGRIFHSEGTMVISSDGSIIDASGVQVDFNGDPSENPVYGGVWITNGQDTGFLVPVQTGVPAEGPFGGYVQIRNNGKTWEFTQSGNINLPESGNISLYNGTTLAQGTFDNMTGGNGGISLNCVVGYELNWQGGRLISTQDGGISAANILCDSAIEFPGSGIDNMEISSSGIIFPDGTTQKTSLPDPGIDGLFLVEKVVDENTNVWDRSIDTETNEVILFNSNNSTLSIYNFTSNSNVGIVSSGIILGNVDLGWGPPSDSSITLNNQGLKFTGNDGEPLNLLTVGPTSIVFGSDATGITFPDGTTQTTAAVGGSTTVVDLTFDTTLNTDASAGDIFDVILTDNATLANPTNPVNGKTLRWRITQDEAGNRTVTLGDKFVIPSSASSPLPWSISSNAMDILAATYHAGRDRWDVVAFVPGY